MSEFALDLERKRRAQIAATTSADMAIQPLKRAPKAKLARVRPVRPFDKPAPTADDEWRKRRPSGGGAGGDIAPTSSRASTPPAARPNAAVKSGLASGSQSAVVKLASYASGGSRVGALKEYLSQEGEVALELDNGTRIEGPSELRALAAKWADESPERMPSKDMLMFFVTVPGQRSAEALGAALSQAMPGHKFAWRAETAAGDTRIEVVAVAASSERAASGKSQRLFDNNKSMEGLEKRLGDAMAGPIKFEERGWSHGVEGAARYLSRLTRGGTKDAVLSNDKPLQGHEANLRVAKEWKHSMRSREQRDVAHIILSAKPGTDRKAFVEAARATLHRVFENHEFAFALHENRQHLHVHAVVKMVGKSGERVDPKISDFNTWRQVLAEEARERNIPMEAASRFETARPPAYQLKDIRRVERGVASDNTRKRVEAVRTNAIHVPTREEGKERARAVAGQWQSVAAQMAREPAIAAGDVRLYRAERGALDGSSLPLFTRDRHVAQALAGAAGARVSYIDVAGGRLNELQASRIHPGRDYLVPRDLAEKRQPFEAGSVENVVQFQKRAEMAVALVGENEHVTNREKSHILRYDPPERSFSASNVTTQSHSEKDPRPMPDLQIMQEKRQDIVQNLDRFVEAVPPDLTEKAKQLRERITANWDEGIERQRKVERTGVSVEGDRVVEPAPKQFDNFTAYLPEKRGETIRYAYRQDDGSAGRVAFEDTGRKVEVTDWRDRDTTLAAMQLAAEKWEILTVKGPPRYQTMVVALAAEHGFKIANPELQDRLEAERIRINAQRDSQPGFTDGTLRQRNSAAETTPATQLSGLEADATAAYREVVSFKTEKVAQFVELVREARHGEGVANHHYEKPESAEVAIALSRREAIGSLSEADQLRFAQASARFVEVNNGISHERLQEAEKRAEKGELPVLRPVEASQTPAQAPTQHEPPAAAERPAAGQPAKVSGEFVSSGRSRYRNESDAEITPHVDMKMENGSVLRVWGVTLPSAIEEADPQVGDRMTLHVAGRQQVEKTVRFKDPETGETRHEVRQVTRNVWEATILERAKQQEGQAASSRPLKTDAELQLEINSLREKTENEAVRETRQAEVATATHEAPGDPGYRSESQAASARSAERAVEASPAGQIPTTPSTSPEIQRLAEEQRLVNRDIEQAEAAKQGEREKPRGQWQ